MYYYFTNICYNNKGLISLTTSKKTGNNFFSPYKKYDYQNYALNAD